MASCTSWTAAALFASAAALAACGTDVSGGAGGSGNGDPASGTATGGDLWISYCEARAAVCGGTADKCKTQEACARTLLRDEVEAALFACLETTCDEDACIQQIAAQYPPTPAGEQFAAACQANLDVCPNGNNDVCAAAWFIADDLLDDLQACTSAPTCAEVDACYDAVRAANVDPCEDWI